MAKKSAKKKASRSKKKKSVKVETTPQESTLKPLMYVLGAILLLFVVVKLMGGNEIELEPEVLDKVDLPMEQLAVGNIIGDANAPVTIVEFSDFQCPYCARAASGTVREIKDKLVSTGRVQFVFKHFPLPGHPDAQKAAEASECAADQGKFWEMHDEIFAKQTAIKVDDLKRYAAALGLNSEAFNDCLDSGRKADKVAADLQEGIDAGVTGTPGFVVNGYLVTGAQPYSVFEDLVEAIESGEDLAQAHEDSSANPDSQLQDSTKDPVIELVVVNDPECEICDASQVLALLQGQLFKTAEVRNVDINSEEGQAFVTTFDLIGIPAYIFSEEVMEGANYPSVQEAFTEEEGWFLLSQQLVGVVKMLQTPSIDGAQMDGADTAPITIVEFSDFECPFCGKFFSETYPLIKSEYVDTGKVKLVFKHFPLPSHSNAATAAEASECAGDQGLFWEMHDELFAHQRSLSNDKIVELATQLELDMDEFNECMTTAKYADKVQSHLEEGVALGITGTPSFFVNDVAVSGAVPYPVFEELLESLLG